MLLGLKLELVYSLQHFNEPLTRPSSVGQASIVGFLHFPVHPGPQAQLLSPPVVQEACLSDWLLEGFKGFRFRRSSI